MEDIQSGIWDERESDSALLKNVIRPSDRPQLCRLNTISSCLLLSLCISFLKQAGER